MVIDKNEEILLDYKGRLLMKEPRKKVEKVVEKRGKAGKKKGEAVK